MASTDHGTPAASADCTLHCAAGVSLPALVDTVAASPHSGYLPTVLPERPPLTIPRPPDRPPITRPA